MPYKKILQMIPVMQSTALAGDNLKFAKKKDKDASDFMGQGVKNIIGLELTSETANIIESF